MTLTRGKERRYDSADRIAAYGNTIRMVYEKVLRPSAYPALSVGSRRKDFEEFSVLADALEF